MTHVSRESFLLKLYEVVCKLSRNAKILSSNLKKEWDKNFAYLNQTPKVIRQIPIVKEKFLNDIDYRIEILDIVLLSFEDGLNTIRFLLDVLYNHYFKDSPQLKEDFDENEQLILKYLVAKEIFGSIPKYNQFDHDIVPLKYKILACIYKKIKLLKGQKDAEILEKLKRIKIELEIDELNKIMDEIVEDGFLNKTRRENYFYYDLKSELLLSNDGSSVYKRTIKQLVKWPTGLWEYYYDIRELNVTVDNEIEYSDRLNNILVRAAIQGYSACHYVFENLVSYYQDIKKDLN
ncbi:MAG: hypothetical protein ACFFBI_08260 [Promethearchaeota archaeon]